MPHPILPAIGAVLMLGLVADAPSWTARLSPTSGSTVAGSATVAPAASARGGDSAATRGPAARYAATLSITGGTPRAALAWHIHEGKCAGSGGVLGSAGDYQAVQLDDRGQGQATASVGAELAPGKDYSVKVHSADAVAACGDLAPGPGGATGR